MRKKTCLLFIISLVLIIFSITFTGCDAIVDPVYVGVPAYMAEALHFYNTDYSEGEIGGTIKIKKARNERHITHYVLYWGSDRYTKTGDAIAELEVTGKDLKFVIPEGTPITDTYLLCFTKNTFGEMPFGVSHKIIDKPIEYTISSSFNEARSVFSVDIDGDGDQDVLGAALNSDGIIWWENDGSPFNGGWITHAIDTSSQGAHCVLTVDIDGDGDLDVLGAANNDNGICWWENDGSPTDGSWVKHFIDISSVDATYVDSADIDGDGDADVVGTAFKADKITWWENDGNPAEGGWIPHEIDTSFKNSLGVYIADIDGDGDVDVLGVANIHNGICWWENDGSPAEGMWEKHSIGTTVANLSVHPVDIDGDGDPDVVGGCAFSNIFWWENVGSPADQGWVKHVIYTRSGIIFGVQVADFDNDGDMDVLGVVSNNANQIIWWENEGSFIEGEWKEHSIGNSFDGTCFICVTDMDSDGELDILVASDENNAVELWKLF